MFYPSTRGGSQLPIRLECVTLQAHQFSAGMSPHKTQVRKYPAALVYKHI